VLYEYSSPGAGDRYSGCPLYDSASVSRVARKVFSECGPEARKKPLRSVERQVFNEGYLDQFAHITVPLVQGLVQERTEGAAIVVQRGTTLWYGASGLRASHLVNP
jgi:hypothetical protein